MKMKSKICLLFCVLLSEFLTCKCSEPYHERGHIEKDAVIVQANCDFLFQGDSFPMPKETEGRGLVKLCQNQVEDDYEGPMVLATLFSTVERIPVYSANVVLLSPNITKSGRPDGKYWHRVSQALCLLDPDQPLPSDPFLSRLQSITDETKCRKYQATAQDYVGNNAKIHIDRGHLSPNSINNQDQERQIATFTLTNAAPQFSEFNQNAWYQYECMVGYVIKEFVPLERVYIITGTMGSAENEHGKEWWMNEDDDNEEEKNPVLIPGYWWKAVCYPGNPWNDTPAWSFVIMQKNAEDEKDSHPENFMPLSKFSNMYFDSDIMGKICMNANSMGPIEKYFKEWGTHSKNFCPLYNNKAKKVHQKKSEL